MALATAPRLARKTPRRRRSSRCPPSPDSSSEQSMRLNTLVLALALSVSAMLPAGAAVKLLELGHEADPRMIRMPDRENGELSLQTCATCKVLRLRATAE